MTVSPITFVKQSYDELKKVTWPTREEVIRLTVAVIIISLVVAFFLGGLDALFAKIVQVIVTR